MTDRHGEEPMESGRPIEWTPDERAALERLARETPPAGLETSVVAALRRRGLVRSGGAGVPTHRRWGWATLALAASLTAFYAGIRVSDRGAGSTSPAPTPSPSQGAPAPERFLLLLYEDDAYRAATTPAERQARVAEYSAWAGEVHAEGTVIDGEELAPPGESQMLDGRSDPVVETGGAPVGPTGTLAGYFVLEAPDAAAAVATARTMPHLEYGGTVVVRRVIRH